MSKRYPGDACIFANTFCKVIRQTVSVYDEDGLFVRKLNFYEVYPIDGFSDMKLLAFYKSEAQAIRAAQSGEYFHNYLKLKGVI